MKIDKFDIIHSLYNAENVRYDSVNDKWTAEDKDGNSINVVSADVDAELAKQNYKNQRMVEYPSIEDQLDLMYHSGFDAWKTKIKETKDKYPKPS
tara:strand:- start:63 stop:347 length:285 start_codon:yes stop_codon:yes gene_type:complete